MGIYGYLRKTVPADLSAACRAAPACRAASATQLRIDRDKLVDGIHPTKIGAASPSLVWPAPGNESRHH